MLYVQDILQNNRKATWKMLYKLSIHNCWIARITNGENSAKRDEKRRIELCTGNSFENNKLPLRHTRSVYLGIYTHTHTAAAAVHVCMPTPRSRDSSSFSQTIRITVNIPLDTHSRSRARAQPRAAKINLRIANNTARGKYIRAPRTAALFSCARPVKPAAPYMCVSVYKRRMLRLLLCKKSLKCGSGTHIHMMGSILRREH